MPKLDRPLRCPLGNERRGGTSRANQRQGPKQQTRSRNGLVGTRRLCLAPPLRELRRGPDGTRLLRSLQLLQWATKASLPLSTLRKWYSARHLAPTYLGEMHPYQMRSSISCSRVRATRFLNHHRAMNTAESFQERSPLPPRLPQVPMALAAL